MSEKTVSPRLITPLAIVVELKAASAVEERKKTDMPNYKDTVASLLRKSGKHRPLSSSQQRDLFLARLQAMADEQGALPEDADNTLDSKALRFVRRNSLPTNTKQLQQKKESPPPSPLSRSGDKLRKRKTLSKMFGVVPPLDLLKAQSDAGLGDDDDDDDDLKTQSDSNIETTKTCSPRPSLLPKSTSELALMSPRGAITSDSMKMSSAGLLKSESFRRMDSCNNSPKTTPRSGKSSPRTIFENLKGAAIKLLPKSSNGPDILIVYQPDPLNLTEANHQHFYIPSAKIDSRDRDIFRRAAPLKTEELAIQALNDAKIDYDRRYASCLLFAYGNVNETSEYLVDHGKYSSYIQKEPYELPKQEESNAVYEIITVVAPDS